MLTFAKNQLSDWWILEIQTHFLRRQISYQELIFNQGSFPENFLISPIAQFIHGCSNKQELAGFSTNQCCCKHCSSNSISATLPGPHHGQRGNDAKIWSTMQYQQTPFFSYQIDSPHLDTITSLATIRLPEFTDVLVVSPYGVKISRWLVCKFTADQVLQTTAMTNNAV